MVHASILQTFSIERHYLWPWPPCLRAQGVCRRAEERALKGLQNLETDLTRLHVPFTLILPRVKTHDHRSRGDTPWRAQTLDVALTLNEGSTRARSAPNFLAQGPQEGSTCTTVSFKSSYYSGVGSPLDAGRCVLCCVSLRVAVQRLFHGLFATMWGKD